MNPKPDDHADARADTGAHIDADADANADASTDADADASTDADAHRDASASRATPEPRHHVYTVQVQFGDCDPAGIVFFPNFNRWMDESSLAFFMACGLPPWRELVKTRGIIGTPLLEINTRFVNSATYGQTLTVRTHVEAWSRKTLRQRHVIRRGETLICEGTEVRAFCVRDAEDADRIRAILVPEDIRQMCS